MNVSPLKAAIPTTPSPQLLRGMADNPNATVVYFHSSTWIATPANAFLNLGDSVCNPKLPGNLFKERGLFKCAERSTIKERLIQVVQVIPQLKYLGVDASPEFQTVEKTLSVVLNLGPGISYMFVTPRDVIAQLLTIQL